MEVARRHGLRTGGVRVHRRWLAPPTLGWACPVGCIHISSSPQPSRHTLGSHLADVIRGVEVSVSGGGQSHNREVQALHKAPALHKGVEQPTHLHSTVASSSVGSNHLSRRAYIESSRIVAPRSTMTNACKDNKTRIRRQGMSACQPTTCVVCLALWC